MVSHKLNCSQVSGLRNVDRVTGILLCDACTGMALTRRGFARETWATSGRNSSNRRIFFITAAGRARAPKAADFREKTATGSPESFFQEMLRDLMAPTPMTRDQFNAGIIAQHADNTYDPSGFVAVVVDGVAYLSRYSHCSCYGTVTALAGESGDLVFNWQGTPEELVAMARRMADPDMPEREASPEDFDYDHLVKVYHQVIQWAASQEQNP